MATHLHIDSEDLAAAIKKSRIEGLISSTGLSGRTGASYLSLQAAIKEKKQLELMGWHEMCETQRLRQIQAQRKAAKERRKAVEHAKISTERRRRKQILRLDFQPPTPNYYEGKAVAPGLFFMKALADIAEKREIRLNIPNTLLFYNGYTWLSSEAGILRTRKEFKIADFFACFVQPENPIEPVAVLRPTNNCGEGTKVALLNWFELSDLMQKSTFPNYGLVQETILSSGKRTAILRLFHRKSQTCTALSYRHLSQKSIISTDVKEEEVEITDLSGHAVSQLKAEGDTVVASLERGLGLRISVIVLDMIKDAQGLLWIISCKGVLFEDSSAAPPAEARQEQQCAMHCSLCLLPHQRFEMSHSLPFRLLMLYKRHVALSGRTLLDLSHIRVNSMDFLSHSVSVCPLCFMLVTTEYELILAEEQLGILLHIPPDSHSLTEEKQVLQPNFMPAAMQKWRVLFYFQDIDIEGNIGRPFLHYSLFGRSHRYRLEPKRLSKSRYALVLARMHYFFATPGATLKTLCHAILMPIRLTRLETSESLMCQGEIRPFRPFAFQFSEGEALCQSLDVLLFNGDDQRGKLKLWVGLMCDKTVAVRTLPVSVERFGGLYIPEEHYMTADLLPDVWMELFDGKTELSRTHILSPTEEIQGLYSPRMKTKDFLAFSEGLEHVLHLGVNLDPLYSQKRRSKRPLIRTQSQVLPPSHPFTVHQFNAQFHIHSPVNSPPSEHEETLQDLQALSLEDSQPLSLVRAASDFLCKRNQSAATRRILSQAQSVVMTAEPTPKHAEETITTFTGAASTIELLPRPKTAHPPTRHIRSASQGTIEKSQRIYGCYKFTPS